MNRFIAACALVFFIFGGLEMFAQELSVGDQAPPFELFGSDGQTHRLGDYEGQTVVLAWFPKAFTGG